MKLCVPQLLVVVSLANILQYFHIELNLLLQILVNKLFYDVLTVQCDDIRGRNE